MQVLSGCPILIERTFRDGWGVAIEGGEIAHVGPLVTLPASAAHVHLPGGCLAPGFIDLQVNGGAGVLFNDAPTVQGLTAIAQAHRRFGTTGFLPTLISDAPEVIGRAIEAVSTAIAAGTPGVLGIHIEGPVLNPAKKGVHDAHRLMALDDALLDLLCSLQRGVTVVTLAPERVAPEQIATLVRRGVIVCAGHTDADYETISRAVDAGLTGFTHLYNAMSQLHSRAPGVVGAALDLPRTWVGLIADGHHVHPAALRIAMKAKGVDQCVLVTDAMPTVGAPDGFDGFTLFDQPVELDAAQGKLTIPLSAPSGGAPSGGAPSGGAPSGGAPSGGASGAVAGVLAGAHLDMMGAVRFAHAQMGASFAQALVMASHSPARAVGLDGAMGVIAPGRRADLVHISPQKQVVQTWIGGVSDSAQPG